MVMRSLVKRIGLEKYYVMQWHIKYGNITTNIKIKAEFTLPELREIMS